MGGGKKRNRQEKEKSSNGRKGGKKKNQSTTSSSDLGGLIANLAKQATDSTAKTTSKEERIQKRAAKKQRRQERQGLFLQKPPSDSIGKPTEEDRKPAARPRPDEERTTRPHATTAASRKRLRHLATSCKESVPRTKSYQKPFEGLHKKKKRRTKQLDDVTVQPRPKDYGGLGLARETLYLQFEDPSFTRRLEDEFQEHVDGFFGKQRTKAMKKQLDGKMLWRQLQNKKNNNIKNKKVDGKKLASMTPDERVEAMLKAGML